MFKKFTLANGFPVIFVPQKDSQSLTLLVLFRVGSRYEDLRVNHGVSHFIEHLMFKGTQKRPTTLDISKELDGIGAEFNAYTSKDHTGYYIKASAEKLDLACDILADMLTNSVFDAQEINKEKGVIIEEIKMYQDQPLQYAEMLFESLIYKNNTLGADIAGTEESIKKMTRENILAYRDSHYEPQNGVIVVAGKITPRTKKILNKYFVQLRAASRQKFAKEFTPFVNDQKAPRILLNYKNTKQVHLTLGFPAYPYKHPDIYALQLLATILGGNMSSRLFIDVRVKKGLCYYIKSQVDVYQDTGNLMIRSGLDINKIKGAISLIMRELKQIKNKGVTARELAMAKDFIKGRTVLQLEESEYLADFFGRQFILANELLTPAEKIKKIMSVSKSQVDRVARDIIKQEKLNLAMISPYKDQKEFIKLLKI